MFPYRGEHRGLFPEGARFKVAWTLATEILIAAKGTSPPYRMGARIEGVGEGVNRRGGSLDLRALDALGANSTGIVKQP
jgi:hypothetical protein